MSAPSALIESFACLKGKVSVQKSVQKADIVYFGPPLPPKRVSAGHLLSDDRQKCVYEALAFIFWCLESKKVRGGLSQGLSFLSHMWCMRFSYLYDYMIVWSCIYLCDYVILHLCTCVILHLYDCVILYLCICVILYSCICVILYSCVLCMQSVFWVRLSGCGRLAPPAAPGSKDPHNHSRALCNHHHDGGRDDFEASLQLFPLSWAEIFPNFLYPKRTVFESWQQTAADIES